MKATELMIGDWVKSRTGMNVKIVCISHDYPCVYEPIPLTTEILEKNGWKETAYWHEYQDNKNAIQCCLPELRGKINGIEVEHFKCEYVHQYQHLLRLCGLDELADNFKI